jgi:hypothetical protein
VGSKELFIYSYFSNGHFLEYPLDISEVISEAFRLCGEIFDPSLNHINFFFDNFIDKTDEIG